jgi:hypothetical protein
MADGHLTWGQVVRATLPQSCCLHTRRYSTRMDSRRYLRSLQLCTFTVQIHWDINTGGKLGPFSNVPDFTCSDRSLEGMHLLFHPTQIECQHGSLLSFTHVCTYPCEKNGKRAYPRSRTEPWHIMYVGRTGRASRNTTVI